MRCSDLVSLKLWGADIDDQGANRSRCCTHLTELTLENTEIHDDTLRRSSPCPGSRCWPCAAAAI